MNKKDQGGQAFPVPADATLGLTVRQWYKGQALAGWLASFAGTSDHPIPEMTTKLCAEIADAMIQEDNKS